MIIHIAFWMAVVYSALLVCVICIKLWENDGGRAVAEVIGVAVHILFTYALYSVLPP